MALEVEPDVARRGLRQKREASVLLVRKQIDLVLPGSPVVQLERCLVAELLEDRRAQPRDARVGHRLPQPLERVDAEVREPLELQARNAGHQREVVVTLPLLYANGQELADAAVLDRVGILRRPASSAPVKRSFSRR